MRLPYRYHVHWCYVFAYWDLSCMAALISESAYKEWVHPFHTWLMIGIGVVTIIAAQKWVIGRLIQDGSSEAAKG